MRVYRINQLTSLSAFPVIFVIKSSILKDFAELSINLIHTFVVNWVEALRIILISFVARCCEVFKEVDALDVTIGITESS